MQTSAGVSFKTYYFYENRFEQRIRSSKKKKKNSYLYLVCLKNIVCVWYFGEDAAYFNIVFVHLQKAEI